MITQTIIRHSSIFQSSQSRGVIRKHSRILSSGALCMGHLIPAERSRPSTCSCNRQWLLFINYDRSYAPISWLWEVCVFKWTWCYPIRVHRHTRSPFHENVVHHTDSLNQPAFLHCQFVRHGSKRSYGCLWEWIPGTREELCRWAQDKWQGESPWMSRQDFGRSSVPEIPVFFLILDNQHVIWANRMADL